MPVAPKTIQLKDSHVYIEWLDGHNSLYSHRDLRLQCRCASCIEEWTKRTLLDPASVPGDVEVMDHIQIGTYAIQFLFSDAHYTGIYTYDFLREICSCDLCSIARKKTDSNRTP
jgi:ATP-binding protein involved in chromosome partitioning